jgi:hypothetical protein
MSRHLLGLGLVSIGACSMSFSRYLRPVSVINAVFPALVCQGICSFQVPTFFKVSEYARKRECAEANAQYEQGRADDCEEQ